MSKTIPLSFLVLIVGSVLGLIGVMLFSGSELGINVGVFCSLLIGSIVILRAHRVGSFTADDRMSFAILWLSAMGFAWRDSTTLHVLGICAMLLLFMLLCLKSMGRRIVDCGPYEAVIEFWRSISTIFNSTPKLVREEISWSELRSNDSSKFRAVARGLLGAVPVLLLFGALLVQSDQRFEIFTGQFFDWDLDTLVSRLLIFTACLWISIALLRSCLLPRDAERQKIVNRDWSAGGIEISIVLSALNVLFFSYILIQSSYFFGDDVLIRQQGSLTYANYARRGFFELVLLSSLLIPLLLVCRWMLRDATAASIRAYRILARLLVAFVLVIVASAMHRMHLYVQAYGLTELRFYTSAFMVWLALIYGWFCATTLMTTPIRFASGVVYSALFAIGLLFVVNPDAFVARTNIERLAETSRLDEGYLLSLSADAVPVLIDAFPTTAGKDPKRITVQMRHHPRWRQRSGWRGWNVSRARARRLLQEQQSGG